MDPRLNVPASDVEKQFKLLLEIRDELSLVNTTVNEIDEVRVRLRELNSRHFDRAAPNVQSRVNALSEKLTVIRDSLAYSQIHANEDTFAYSARPDAKLAYLSLAVAGDTNSAPTEAEYAEFTKLKQEISRVIGQWTDLKQSDLVQLSTLLGMSKSASVGPFAHWVE